MNLAELKELAEKADSKGQLVFYPNRYLNQHTICTLISAIETMQQALGQLTNIHSQATVVGFTIDKRTGEKQNINGIWKPGDIAITALASVEKMLGTL